LVSLFTYLSWNYFAWALLIIPARYFAIWWNKSYIFSSLSFENCMRNKVSLFYSNLKCLNFRLFILFEHTYYIFIQLVLEKDLFQTRVRFKTRVRFQKKPPVCMTFYSNLHWRAQCFSHKSVVFSTETKGISVKILTWWIFKSVYLFLTTFSALNSEIKSLLFCHRTLRLKMPAVKVWIKNTSNILNFSHLFHPLFIF
jgi:hypothetical protein